MFFLVVMFGRALYILYKSSSYTDGSIETINKKLFSVNIFFFGAYLIASIIYVVSFWFNISIKEIGLIFTYEFIRIGVEFIALYLASLFGH